VINSLGEFIDVDDDSVSELYDDLNDDVSMFTDIYADLDDFLQYRLGASNDKQVDTFRKAFKLVAKDPQMQLFMKLVKQWDNYDPYKSKAKVNEVKQMYIVTMNAFKDAKQVFAPMSKVFSAGAMKRIEKQMAQYQKDMLKPEIPPDFNKKVIDGFGFTNKNFDAALKSEHEVCILGEYIAVDYDRYKDELEKYFLGPKPSAGSKKGPVKKVTSKKKPVLDDEDDYDEDY
jgi:hypothetical protein